MKQYLQHDEVIDWQHPTILAQANRLAAHSSQRNDIIRHCFEFVRDEIDHSGDFNHDQTTCKASDVLVYKTGWCYAKSHLLTALLRANNIPAGLCYQRLTIEGDHAPFCLHGLNAVLLDDQTWYRIDARGNKENIHAEFCPPFEKLAFPITHAGEADINGIWPQALPMIVHLLENNHSCQAIREQLPDIELFT